MTTTAASTGANEASERMIPGQAPVYLFEKHASRYQFIAEHVKGKRLLDIGCGDGYGTYYLAQYARETVGVDISPDVIDQARSRYKHPHLSFLVMDSTNLNFTSRSMDAICSFEMIEHVPNVDQFLEETNRVLDEHGIFFVSTPNKQSYVAAGHNTWHVKEYVAQEFYELLNRHFPVVELYGQFCQRPARRRLYQLSSWLYFRSPMYRMALLGVAPLYIRALWGKQDRTRTNWVESVRPGLFEFDNAAPEQADSFLAICKKQS